MRTTRLSISLAASLQALVLLLAGCQREPAPKVEAPRPVRSIVLQPQASGGTLTLPAEIRPRVEIRYGFRVGGKIAQRLVSAGDRVRAGQVLARLDPQDSMPAVAAARATLEAARTDAKLATAELQRLRSLRDQNFISQAALDRQQAAFDSAGSRIEAAQAQLRQASNALEFGTLKADGPGHVVAIEAEAGQVVAAGQPIVRVARSGEIEALVNVPERDLAQARALRRWSVRVPAAGERELVGSLREVSPVADPASRTWPIRLSLSGDLSGVELGMTASVSGGGAASDALLVPISALQSTDATPKVWVVDPVALTVKPANVRTAGFVGEQVRIVEGLAAGDRVVTAGANLLTPGQKVKLLEPNGSQR